MQEECSFQHFSVQYEFELENVNILRMKVGYFKTSRLTICVKMRILKIGGTTIQMGILYVLLNICQYLYCLGYMARLAI